MSPLSITRPSAAIAWSLVLAVLIAARLAAIAEPAGNDQQLYLYTGARLFEGGVPYVDAWDQKPPGIFAVYGALWQIWPRESAVAIADTVAAGLVAALLVALGRRTGDAGAGRLAAVLFLVGSHPSLGRLSGVYIRGQCETFIAAAIAAALVLTASRSRTRARLVGIGLCLGAAFWIKYNAAAYALPVAAGLLVWPRPGRRVLTDLAWIALGGVALSVTVLAYFAAHHALEALKLATIDYNVRYSQETYAGGWIGGAKYLVAMPVRQMRADGLWYLGGLGALVLAASLVIRIRRGTVDRAVIALAWIAAAVASILINGARDLPQYFVQAAPALAMAAAWGYAALPAAPRVRGTIVLVVVAAGAWRVGVEAPAFAGLRLAGLPQLARNLSADVAMLAGRRDRGEYLARFRGGQKYDAPAIDDLARLAAATTSASDRIFVFGFAPGVYVNSGRISASRFFWSRPVILEFAADRPGYGSAGLLADLTRTPPAIVALQKQDWFPDVANSADFFLHQPALRGWLERGYTLERDTPVFSIWRRRS